MDIFYVAATVDSFIFVDDKIVQKRMIYMKIMQWVAGFCQRIKKWLITLENVIHILLFQYWISNGK